jgi:hypothetical protein
VDLIYGSEGFLAFSAFLIDGNKTVGKETLIRI